MCIISIGCMRDGWVEDSSQHSDVKGIVESEVRKPARRRRAVASFGTLRDGSRPSRKVHDSISSADSPLVWWLEGARLTALSPPVK